MNTPVHPSRVSAPPPNGRAPLPSVQSIMGFRSGEHCDPVTRAERNMTALNPNIDNNGGSLYNNEAFCIVYRYETSIEQQCRENYANGKGYIPDVQEYILEQSSFYNTPDDDWYASRAYDEETYESYRTYYDPYIQMVEEGEMIDDVATCRMAAFDMGESINGVTVIDETDPSFMGPPAPTDSENVDPENINKDEPDLMGPPSPFAAAFSNAAQPVEEEPEPVTPPAPHAVYQAPSMGA